MVVCHLLPETLFGYDTDEIFAYTTQKSVWIRDRWVGFGFYCLLSLICMWVVFGQILWRNEHFQLKDVHGVPRIWYSHPTVDSCDPNDGNCNNDWTPLSQIPYCTQFGGKTGQTTRPAECIYGDKRSLAGVEPTGIENRIFIPTQKITFTEEKGCDPSAANGYSCSNEYVKLDHPGSGYYDTSYIRYFADIENIRLQFTSSYHRDTIAGTSLEHKSFTQVCNEKPPDKKRFWNERIKGEHADCPSTTRPFKCQEGQTCDKANTEAPAVVKSVKDNLKDVVPTNTGLIASSQRLRRSRLPHGAQPTPARVAAALQVESDSGSNASEAGELDGWHHGHHGNIIATGISGQNHGLLGNRSLIEEEGYWSTDWGDVILMSKILELAGVNLDKDYNLDSMTTRQAGTVIEVEVIYGNLLPVLSSFGYSPVSLYYKVRERPMPYVTREMMTPKQPADYPNSRTYEVQHGILIVFSVSGTFGFFNIVYFLIMLTVASGLLGVATKVTDILSIYIHPRRKNYFHLKYEVSPDFSDMWECKVCGYFNHHSADECSGVERWCSALDDDTHPCGAKKGAPSPPEAPAATDT